jgi:hypothetical protein
MSCVFLAFSARRTAAGKTTSGSSREPLAILPPSWSTPDRRVAQVANRALLKSAG